MPSLFVCLAQFAINLATALDGAYIGCGRLRHYLLTTGASTAALALIFLFSLTTGRAGLGSAWAGLAVFSALRCFANLSGLPGLRAELLGKMGDGGQAGER